jgi:hypothetical protein
MTIDAPKLQPYFHEREAAGRVPLVVSFAEPPRERPTLSKFGVPVVIKAKGDVKAGEAVLQIERLAVEPAMATVEFVYRVEGIAGKGTFRRRDSSWHLEDFTVVER